MKQVGKAHHQLRVQFRCGWSLPFTSCPSSFPPGSSNIVSNSCKQKKGTHLDILQLWSAKNDPAQIWLTLVPGYRLSCGGGGGGGMISNATIAILGTHYPLFTQ